ncbi:hypothetical protein CGCSCA5_v007095 [Colletotrichum siamense]|nr:hypothetical protein CGCSCA5_v007095 [Colletotrichum siamense]
MTRSVIRTEVVGWRVSKRRVFLERTGLHALMSTFAAHLDNGLKLAWKRSQHCKGIHILRIVRVFGGNPIC